jgi:hypothetical protein
VKVCSGVALWGRAVSRLHNSQCESREVVLIAKRKILPTEHDEQEIFCILSFQDINLHRKMLLRILIIMIVEIFLIFAHKYLFAKNRLQHWLVISFPDSDDFFSKRNSPKSSELEFNFNNYLDQRQRGCLFKKKTFSSLILSRCSTCATRAGKINDFHHLHHHFAHLRAGAQCRRRDEIEG